MKIEIWSDIVCPFCYIGKRKFEQALSQFAGKDQPVIQWRSFQLDPHAQPEPGVSMAQSLAKKKGWSMEQTVAMMEQVTGMAREVGLEYRLDKAVMANTFMAHQLTHLAALYGKQDQAEDQLFHAYFSQGANIGDPKVLEQIAAELGLAPEETKATLAGNRFSAAVLRDQQEAAQLGIRGVPYFVFNNKYAVSGAQPSEVFTQVLQKLYKAEQPTTQLSTGICTLDEACI